MRELSVHLIHLYTKGDKEDTLCSVYIMEPVHTKKTKFIKTLIISLARCTQ